MVPLVGLWPIIVAFLVILTCYFSSHRGNLTYVMYNESWQIELIEKFKSYIKMIPSLTVYNHSSVVYIEDLT